MLRQAVEYVLVELGVVLITRVRPRLRRHLRTRYMEVVLILSTRILPGIVITPKYF